MKALRIIGIIVIVLAAIYFIGGRLLPKSYSFQRSILIKAADSVVYMNVADSNFSFEKTADGINVTWSLSGESKTLPDRWMGLGMGIMMNKPFKSGLESLKELSEQ